MPSGVYHYFASGDRIVIVRLTKKLAAVLDGVDVSRCAEGDVIELPEQLADLLVAEGWAEQVASDDVTPRPTPMLPESRPGARNSVAAWQSAAPLPFTWRQR